MNEEIKTTETAEVIVVRQLPIIEEQLHRIKAEIEGKVGVALALDCTDDTVKTVKQYRAELNALRDEYETKRKDVKSKILGPYEQFERIYKECISDPLKEADNTLRVRIAEIEQSAKDAKNAAVEAFFDEYRQSIGLTEDDAPYRAAKINVTLSASLKSLKEAAKRYLDSAAESIAMIRESDYPDETVIEYRKTGNAAQAILIVNQRHREIEAERERAEAKRADLVDQLKAMYGAAEKVDEAIEAETLTAPVEIEAPTEAPAVEVTDAPDTFYPDDFYEVTFTVRGTIPQLKKLKEFLNNGGYDYE